MTKSAAKGESAMAKSSAAPATKLKIVDLRHQKNGQIKISEDGKPYRDIANVFAKNAEAAEIAEFIVRACNAHQALYEALSALLLECGLAAISGEPLQKDNEKVAQARAAIKLAEGA